LSINDDDDDDDGDDDVCCQTNKWCQFNKAELTVVEVLDLMNNLLDESDPDVRIRENV